jgi:regulator of replication initiation timing
MASTSELTKKLTSEMSDQRQRLNELQQEFDESKQKREQLIQSKELVINICNSSSCPFTIFHFQHMNKLKQLESQLVNSPMRFKQDLSIAAASLKTLSEEVNSREATLNKRQDMEKGLSAYISVLKQVKEMAQQVGDLNKKISRCLDNNNELLIEKQKLATAHEKLIKEKLGAADRLQKLQQKSSSVNQTLDRKLAEMSRTYIDLAKCEA